jgi:hypothetical protein
VVTPTVNNVCKCPATKYYNSSTHTCETCLTGAIEDDPNCNAPGSIVNTSCVFGAIVDGNACKCPSGYHYFHYYANGYAGAVCKVCPEGQYNPIASASSTCQTCLGIGTSTRTCSPTTGGALECVAGYGLSGASGASGTVCNACAAGQYSPGGAVSCTPCSAVEKPNADSSACIGCPANSSFSGTGQLAGGTAGSIGCKCIDKWYIYDATIGAGCKLVCGSGGPMPIYCLTRNYKYKPCACTNRSETCASICTTTNNIGEFGKYSQGVQENQANRTRTCFCTIVGRIPSLPVDPTLIVYP